MSHRPDPDLARGLNVIGLATVGVLVAALIFVVLETRQAGEEFKRSAVANRALIREVRGLTDSIQDTLMEHSRQSERLARKTIRALFRVARKAGVDVSELRQILNGNGGDGGGGGGGPATSGRDRRGPGGDTERRRPPPRREVRDAEEERDRPQPPRRDRGGDRGCGPGRHQPARCR